MIRGELLINNISNLHTFALLQKNNEILENYITLLFSKRKQSITYNKSFESTPLDILYLTLQLMGNKEKITTKEINKFDQKELKYHLDKIGGLQSIRKQSPNIKELSTFITYIITSLTHGNYTIGINNDIKFENNLVLKIDWLIDFSTFINISLDNNKYIIDDGLTYSIKICEIPNDNKLKINDFLKNIKLYQYNIKRKDYKNISLANIKYLNNIFSQIKEYNFNELKQINSVLSKEKYILSIDKIKLNIDSKNKTILTKYYQENGYDEELIELIKDITNCHNSHKENTKQKINDTYEIIRALAHTYKNQVNITECRNLINKNDESLIKKLLLISNFYINYIYDSNNLDKYLNYSTLNLDSIRPNIINYETKEYKDTIKLLSSLNKKLVSENSKINKLIEISNKLNESTQPNEYYLNNQKLKESCNKLDMYAKQIKAEREKLTNAKSRNLSKNNINYSKIKYLKEAIYQNNIIYDKDTIKFTYINKKFQKVFNLEIKDIIFKEILLSDKNKNTRIEFYSI